MSNVYSLAIYRQLARMEQIADHLNARGIRLRDEMMLLHAGNLRDACKGMSDALAESQRERTEQQLRASLELIGRSPG
jgi:hypothetical protein